MAIIIGASSDTDLSKVIPAVNQHLGTTSTNVITENDREMAITQAVQWLYSEGFTPDIFTRTYEFNYFDTLHYYDLQSSVAPDFMAADDLRIADEDSHTLPFTYKKPRELALEINSFEEDAFTIERRDQKTFLGIVHQSEYGATNVHDCDSLTDNGTWAAGGGGSNLTADTNEYKEGDASLNFDLDGSTAGTLINSTMSAVDMSDDEDLSSLFCWVYMPTAVTNVIAVWGSSASAYWTSATTTTDAFGASFSAASWHRLKFDWNGATQTGSVDESAIDYLKFTFTYTGSADTDFRLDDIKMVRPEKLKLFYKTWYVGKDTNGTAITVFTASTDVPWFSGIYDHLMYPVSIKAASILFAQLVMPSESLTKAKEAQDELDKIKKKFPSHRMPQTKSFKPHGVSW